MTVLVTGTTGGIGGAVERLARSRGHRVVPVNRADFESAGPERVGLAEDATGLDAIVFATGTCPIRPAALTSDALFAETVHANCGLFLSLMRTVLAERRFALGGMRVVAVSSVSAVEGWPGGAAYCASKGALSALCRALDAELKAKNIRVTSVEPRYVKTRMFDEGAGRMGVPASAAVAPEKLAAEILDLVEKAN